MFAMKPYSGVEVQLQAFLISALDVDEWFGFWARHRYVRGEKYV